MAAWRTLGVGALVVGGLSLAASLSAYADTPASGVAIAVVQQAQANGDTGQRILQQDAPVYSGDAIVTGPVGQAQVKFRDNTKLVVGPNSRIVVDAFVYGGNNTARQLSINALKGAFRFISGNSRHDAYSITTPTATIGVRGTELDVVVGQGVVFYKGAGDVCTRGNGSRRQCVTVTGGCSLTTFAAGQGLRPVTSISARNANLLRNFRYAVQQNNLLPEFRADTASCGQLRPAVPVFRDRPAPPPSSPPPPPPPPPPLRRRHHRRRLRRRHLIITIIITTIITTIITMIISDHHHGRD